MKKLILISLIFLSFTYRKDDDFIIDREVNSCEVYRNIKITFVNCNDSWEFVANCKCESNRIVVKDIMKFPEFVKAYERSTYIKIRLLKATSCEEFVIKN